MKNSPSFPLFWWSAIVAMLVLLMLPSSGSMFGPMVFWMLLVFGLFILLGLMGPASDDTSKEDTGSASDEADYA